MPQVPGPGRLVHYRLSQTDCQVIGDARTKDSTRHGNTPTPGDIVPMIVVRTFGGTAVNGQAFLDGNDVLWKTSAPEGTENGTWSWPVRT